MSMGCLRSKRAGTKISTSSKNGGVDMNNMPEINRQRSGDVSIIKSQIAGVLYKKPVGHQSSKWSKRYFILKDGWLLYYAENERRELEKRRCLNIHPKGAIPMGECRVTATKEANQPFALCLESAEMEGNLVLGAENEFERDKWLELLQKAGRVTWSNIQLSDTMIQQLESQGQQMAQEKQDVFDRLQSEVLALSDEKIRTEELEKLNKELEKEKTKMESFMDELQQEYDKIKGELEETQDTMSKVETERSELTEVLSRQEASLEDLGKEKEKILNKLQERESKNKNLAQVTEGLRKYLKEIEEKTETLLHEKAEAENRWKENEEWALQLAEEKQHFSEHAQELQATIKDLTVQKEMTEAELKEEVRARLDAEKRLRNAELSVANLDRAVLHETPNIEEKVKEEMIVDVKRLKKFFEDLAAEASLDSDKPIVVKNAIHARKTIVRKARSQKFESRRRSNVLRHRTSSLDELRGDREKVTVRRAATTVYRDTRSVPVLNHSLDETSLMSPIFTERL
ncbi:pleckstrin homology domain-containing family D member 1-like [Liolophura sinensis]|uniref:pleckstrin homology domain-containing family D member 1-like n=1 Tax=Liolophura sinensis TaxID=3198878 RepID=UPI003158F7BD